MPTMTKVESPKVAGFVDRGYNHTKKQARLKAEEEEIARLEAEARGEVFEGDQEVTTAEAEKPAEVVEEKVVEPQEKDEGKEPTSPEEKSFKKRYGDLRRHLQKKEEEWQQKFETLEAKLSNTPIRAPKSDEDIESWAKKYPDIAAIVETIATKKAEEKFKSADSRFQELDRLNEEARVMKAENLIRLSHSDFDELRDSDDFHTWAEEQPKWVQDALYENMDDPASVVRVIDLYKVDKGLTPSAKKSKSKDAAKSISTKTKTSLEGDPQKGSFRESEVAKMSDKEFEANMDAILEAQRTGKFVYDVSGSAR